MQKQNLIYPTQLLKYSSNDQYNEISSQKSDLYTSQSQQTINEISQEEYKYYQQYDQNRIQTQLRNDNPHYKQSSGIERLLVEQLQGKKLSLQIPEKKQTKKSQELAVQKLFLKKQQSLAKLDNLRQQVYEQEIAQLNSKPKITNYKNRIPYQKHSYMSRQIAKNKEFQNQVSQQELMRSQGCTFSPSVSRKSLKMCRSIDNLFLWKQQIEEKHRQAKCDSIERELETFQMFSTCEGTKQILKQKCNQINIPVSERLYEFRRIYEQSKKQVIKQENKQLKQMAKPKITEQGKVSKSKVYEQVKQQKQKQVKNKVIKQVSDIKENLNQFLRQKYQSQQKEFYSNTLQVEQTKQIKKYLKRLGEIQTPDSSCENIRSCSKFDQSKQSNLVANQNLINIE